MAKAVQYYNGTDYTQFGLDVADYTIRSGVYADLFYSIKTTNDDCYIITASTGNNSSNRAKIIKIDKDGNKKVATVGLSNSTYTGVGANPFFFIEQRNGSIWCRSYLGSTWSIWIVPEFNDGDILTPSSIGLIVNYPIALYQDRYIWSASGTTVKIYDYTTKAELASGSMQNVWYSIVVAVDNSLYTIEVVNGKGFVRKYEYLNTTTLQITKLNTEVTDLLNTKQLLLDKYGDLIILTNSGTASTLLKYTTAGVQIGTTLNLGGAFYNLNTDKDGNYYYSNALGTYKITANTAQGEAFTGVGTKIRGSGMTTYGNNITNYNPAVFGTQE